MDLTKIVEKPLLPLESDKPVPNKANKEELISSIKEWIKLDNDIAKAKSDIKEKTIRKKTLTDNLVVIMKGNSIDCFDINGGALLYKQKKTKKPISAKYLLQRPAQCSD